ncbi:hypothetical protein Vadar_019870 [Vaccinium darrowii]|uniref:Uncharacterized protein n=1 Tax=Vaccinium darrowii TaxID=229202 RepID=A0ACB7Y1M9_9ERIC|nr:hypothetical protein Vadar_019870 [Vaccinium darrowii]
MGRFHRKIRDVGCEISTGILGIGVVHAIQLRVPSLEKGLSERVDPSVRFTVEGIRALSQVVPVFIEDARRTSSSRALKRD